MAVVTRWLPAIAAGLVIVLGAALRVSPEGAGGRGAPPGGDPPARAGGSPVRGGDPPDSTGASAARGGERPARAGESPGGADATLARLSARPPSSVPVVEPPLPPAGQGEGEWTLQVGLFCDPATIASARRELVPGAFLSSARHDGRECARLCWGRFATKEDARRATPPGGWTHAARGGFPVRVTEASR